VPPSGVGQTRQFSRVHGGEAKLVVGEAFFIGCFSAKNGVLQNFLKNTKVFVEKVRTNSYNCRL
jgi:hypothetical protein